MRIRTFNKWKIKNTRIGLIPHLEFTVGLGIRLEIFGYIIQLYYK